MTNLLLDDGLLPLDRRLSDPRLHNRDGRGLVLDGLVHHLLRDLLHRYDLLDHLDLGDLDDFRHDLGVWLHGPPTSSKTDEGGRPRLCLLGLSLKG